MVELLCKEIQLRKNELPTSRLETIYFGGGTPSLLSQDELEQIFDTIFQNFDVLENTEITLEANPDDLIDDKLELLKMTPINRLSIGVQSFFDRDLKLMNRAHNSAEAFNSLKKAKELFENISIDLIYGIPGQSNTDWQKNLDLALDLEIPHVSSYALTVEANTALEKFIEKGNVQEVGDEQYRAQFDMLVHTLTKNGFEQYEFSNFGKPGYYSRNNMAYWMGKPYLGIGPSAHSYDGSSRKWNISNNPLYIKSLQTGKIPQQEEILSVTDKYNEFVMTRLRTKFGVNIQDIEEFFGKKYAENFMNSAEIHLKDGTLWNDEGTFRITEKGKRFTCKFINTNVFHFNALCD